MLRLIGAYLGRTRIQGAALVTATLTGAVIGGVGFGMPSDRLGRVRVLTRTIVLCGLQRSLCAGARVSEPVGVSTFASIGLGSGFGIGIASTAGLGRQ
jgi:MFS family permease